MDELRTNARELLERAKPSFAPSDEQIERVRHRLLSGPKPPDDGADAPPDSGAPPTTAANWAWYAGALVLVGFFAVGAAVVGSGSPGAVADGGMRRAPSLASPPPQQTTSDLGTVSASHPSTEGFSASPQLSQAVAGSPSPSPAASSSSDVRPPSDKPAAAVARSSPRRAATRPSSAPEATPDSFAAELELVMAARKALEARDFVAARKTAQRYLQRFSEGSFVEEARVLRLLARCGIERSDDVVDRARAYAQAHDSAFARRVRAACLDDPR